MQDPKFITQKEIRLLVDKDAGGGYESKTSSFHGYKLEFAMIPETRIITAVAVENVAYVDGSKFDELYESSKECGLDIKEVYSDQWCCETGNHTVKNASKIQRIAALISFFVEDLGNSYPIIVFD